MFDLHCSNGPVSTLPGSIHPLPADTRCDAHPNELAIVRLQGETDSFGCEYVCMCGECHAKYLKDIAELRTQKSQCQWCRRLSTLRPYRDPDEGSYGPVYNVCQPCIVDAIERQYED